MAELSRQSGTDPRRSAAWLLEVMRDGRWRTRAELQAIVGKGWPLLLRSLESAGHGLVFERSRRGPGWFRVRVAYVLDVRPTPAAPEPEQLGLAISGSLPPRSALLGLEDAA